jgi:pimeloyl-ACP methyl ester carboxylesterase
MSSDVTDFAPAAFGTPSLSLLGSEPFRAGMEYLRAVWMDRSVLPRGDGHPVVVYPGLAADAAPLRPLVRCCEELGYLASDWGRGRNNGPVGDLDRWLDDLADDILALADEHGQAVSLVGWSLGGIYAREIARRVPGTVR